MEKLTPYRLLIAIGLTSVTTVMVTVLGLLMEAGTATSVLSFVLCFILGSGEGRLLYQIPPARAEKRQPLILAPFLMTLAGLSPVAVGVAAGIDPKVWESWLFRVNHSAMFLLSWDGYNTGAPRFADYLFALLFPAILVWLGVFVQSKYFVGRDRNRANGDAVVPRERIPPTIKH